MTTPNIYKCPECGEDASDFDCPDCAGSGEVFTGDDIGDSDSYEECAYCDGNGTIYGEFECNACGHTYEETD